MTRPIGAVTELEPGATWVQHRDPEVVFYGYFGLFLGLHPHNPDVMYVDCGDDDLPIAASVADWEIVE